MASTSVRRLFRATLMAMAASASLFAASASAVKPPDAGPPPATECGDAGANVLDLTVANSTATIDGAIYNSVDATGSVGTGVFPAFVKIGANTDCVEGYNTDGTREFDTFNSPLFAIQLNSMAIVTIGTTDYVEFVLDINQEKNDPMLSLDNVQIFASTSKTLTGWTDCLLGGVACLYDMDATANSTILLNYTLNNGSGNGLDMSLFVPISLFAAFSDPSKTYVYLYSHFGAYTGTKNGEAFINNDGQEEWAYKYCPRDTVCWEGFPPPPPPPTNVPEPATLALFGTALLATWLNRRRAARKLA